MNPISIETDAAQLCGIIRCLVEEWGPDHFQIQLPRVWAACVDNGAFDCADMQFVTDDSLVLLLGQGKNCFRREIKLAPACISGL